MDRARGRREQIVFWAFVLSGFLVSTGGQTCVANDFYAPNKVEKEIERQIRKQLFPPKLFVRRPSVFEITLAPDGKLMGCKKVKSSGQLLIDKSAERAIIKAKPYPHRSTGPRSALIYLVTVDPYQILSAGRPVHVEEKNSLALLNRSRQ